LRAPFYETSLAGFPPHWSVELIPNYFSVRDADGQALSYIYYESGCDPPRLIFAEQLGYRAVTGFGIWPSCRRSLHRR
jgi:hypothetical protein